MLSNTKWRVFAFDKPTGDPVTGNAANITAKLAIDYGTRTALADVNPVEAEDGFYHFDLTEAERTGTWFELYPESSTSGVQVMGDPPHLSASGSSGGASGGRGGTYRRTTDLSPVLFTFPTGGLADNAFTKTLRIDGGSPSNVTGAISYLYQIGGKHWYRLAYDAADRPASGADGVVQYLFTDGTDTVVVGLVVGGSAIAAKTELIGTGNATTPAPVTPSGVLGPLVSGDDYKTANNRALVWTTPTVANPASCSLGIRKNDGVSLVVTGTATHVEGIASLTFELEDTQTAIFVGRCRFSVEYVDGSGNEVTVQEGPVDFLRKYT